MKNIKDRYETIFVAEYSTVKNLLHFQLPLGRVWDEEKRLFDIYRLDNKTVIAAIAKGDFSPAEIIAANVRGDYTFDSPGHALLLDLKAEALLESDLSEDDKEYFVGLLLKEIKTKAAEVRSKRVKAKTPLHDKIRKARLSAGLSQIELAKKLGVAQARISEWESGKHAPSGDTLFDIARVTGTLAIDLL